MPLADHEVDLARRTSSARSRTCTDTSVETRCRTGGRPARRRSWLGWVHGSGARYSASASVRQSSRRHPSLQ